MANINEILARAASLRDETALNSIDPERAGGIMYDTLLALNELWLQQGAALVISKIYASVADMNADTSPVSDLTGKPIRPGMIVVVASFDSDNGTVYRYNGTAAPSWSMVGSIGNVSPVDSLDSDSAQLPLAARQGKVLDGKISQLGQEVKDTYGDYVENSEWVRVVSDSEDKILYGVKTDGKFYFGDGCPPQVVEYVSAQLGSFDASDYDDIKTFLGNLIDGDTLATLLNAKLDRDGLDADALATVQAIENPEYMEVTTDSEDKILEGITSEGVKRVNIPIDTPSAATEHIDNPEWIYVKTDINGNIVFGIDKNGIIHGNIAENKEVSTKKIAINGLIPNAPEVKALKGNDAPIIADEYDQFDTYINLWDSLLSRANQYGTYVEKCWIDGTPYDDSNKIMSDLPTAGSHNPRNDMNQYPLIMYKFIPNLYTESFKYKPDTKKVLIVSGIHGGSSGGDHWESPMAVYYFAKRLVEEFYLTDSLTHLREFVEFDFVPAANPWGLNNLYRRNGQDIDINRDFSEFVTVTAQQLKSLIDSKQYSLFWDSHCLGGTSLTSGDLTTAHFFWEANGDVERCIGREMLTFIGAKYSVPTMLITIAQKTAVGYADNKGLISILTEIPANTPLYYGDTTGDVHGEEVMKRDADFIQNAITSTCNLLLKNII